MNIILKKDVEKLGFKNEIITVKNGFARNFLIPKGFAVLATESAIKVLEENLRQQTQKETTEIEAANKLAESLKKAEIVIKAKVSEDGVKLFGSVKVSQFIEALSLLGHKIESKFIKITSIKEIGDYNLK